MRILVIEDDPGIVHFLTRGLAAHGHQVISTETGNDGALLAADETVEFVILDIALPGFDGHEVLNRIRALRPALPVLMLTARDDLAHKVRALNAGADDYLTKPFAFEELLARIRAILRRGEQPQATQLQAGELRVDVLSRRVWHGDTAIELSNREFTLLEYFMSHPGQVLSRQQILNAVWEYDFDPDSNVVDVYVRYLRRKIDRSGQPSLITTVRGAGYRFELAPDA
ncbi:MAG TPA: response regulator transcription factor [Ardenticatenaceae bacterium]|nr:response regulator transcription factor [Ardenticatenaceae bacterium]